MAEWNTIKQDFIKWLKAEEIDFNEDSKDFAPLKFKEKFKLFIEKEGENVNMDSFIKTNDKDNKLVTKMVSDYVDDLDKDGKAFKALDTNDDGSISCDEKENFIEKAMKAGFDGNKDDFSFDDFTTAAEKLEAGDDEFLKDEDEEKVDGAAGAGGVGGAGGGGGNGGNVPPADPQNQNPQDPADPANAYALTVEQAMKLDSPMVNYTPTTTTAPKLSIKSVSQEGENITPSKAETGVQVGEYLKMPVADMVSSRENICNEMTAASEHFADFSASFAEANEFLTASKEAMAQNEAQYDAIIENLAQSNENVKLANDQVTEYQNVIDATNTNINTLCAAKDATEASIVATDAQISSLQANLYVEVTDYDKDGKPCGSHLEIDPGVQAALNAAEEQKQQLQQELETITQSLLENRETLLEANKQLQTSYDNLKSALEGVDFNSAEERENVMSMVHNKQEFSQASVDMNAAKAGMVAMDAYTVSLNSELNSIDKAIEIRLAKDSSLTEQERTTLGEEANAVAPDKLDYSATEYTDPETGEPQQIEGLRKTNIDENATNNANSERDWTSGKFEGFTCVTDAGTVTVTQENGKYIYRFEDGSSYTINPRKDTASYANAGGSELYSSAGAVGEEKTIVTRQPDGLIITTKMSGEGEIQNVDVSVPNQNGSKPTSIYGYSLTSDNKLSEASSYDPATGERFEYKNTYAENGLLTGYERTSKAKDGTTSTTGETYTYDDQDRMTSATTSVDGKKVSETTYGYADTDKGYVETQIQTQYDENENKTQAIVTQTIMPGDGTSTVTITVNNYDGKKDPSSTREVVNTYDSEGKMLASTRSADGKSVLETVYGYNEEDDYQTSEDATQCTYHENGELATKSNVKTNYEYKNTDEDEQLELVSTNSGVVSEYNETGQLTKEVEFTNNVITKETVKEYAEKYSTETITEYHENGKTVTENYGDIQGRVRKTVTEYNQAGIPTGETVTWKIGANTSTTNTTFDEQGRPSESEYTVKGLNHEYIERSRTTYAYDELGNVEEAKTILDPQGNATNTTSVTKDSQGNITGKSETTYKYGFTGKLQGTITEVYDKDNKQTQTIGRNYRSDGTMESESVSAGRDGKGEEITTTTYYDKNGNPTGKQEDISVMKGDLETSRTLINYDAEGNQVSGTRWETEVAYTDPDTGQVYYAQIQYELFDGKWVQTARADW